MQYNRQTNFTQGTVIDSEQVDAEFDAIKNVLNGNIDDDNMASGGTSATISKIYPVGSIYITTNADNPGTILGIGTWAVFGAGKVLVGQDTADTDFDTVEETGGGKTHSHSGNTGGQSADHDHYLYESPRTGTAAYVETAPAGSSASASWSSTSPISGASNDHTHAYSMGSGTANSTIQPYIVVKMWKRTA